MLSTQQNKPALGFESRYRLDREILPKNSIPAVFVPVSPSRDAFCSTNVKWHRPSASNTNGNYPT